MRDGALKRTLRDALFGIGTLCCDWLKRGSLRRPYLLSKEAGCVDAAPGFGLVCEALAEPHELHGLRAVSEIICAAVGVGEGDGVAVAPVSQSGI